LKQSSALLVASVDWAVYWVRCRLRGQLRSASTWCQKPPGVSLCDSRDRDRAL